MPKKLNTLATLGDTPVDPYASFAPPDMRGFEPPQLPPMSFDVQTQTTQHNIPYMQGGITLPFFGNDLQLQYGQQRNVSPYDPTMHDFRATLQRRF